MHPQQPQRAMQAFRAQVAATTLCFMLCCAAASATVHEYRLENGLKVLIKEDHRAPVAVSQIWYKVGSSYEHNGITGISHVLEHMMFKGTSQHPGNRFSRLIAEQGGNDNAFTGRDYTVYFQTLERSRLGISLALEADRMKNLLLSGKDFTKEIAVVKEERRLRTEDNPQAYTWETAMATAFQTSTYRQPIIGWMRDLDALRVAQLQTWYQRYYGPNNATLVIAGDVDPEQTMALVYQYFAPLAKLPVPSIPLPDGETPQRGSKRIEVQRPAKLPWLTMLYKVPSLGTAGTEVWEPYALEVLTAVLSFGDSARLTSRLVRGRETATHAHASYNMLNRLPTVLSLSGTPAPQGTILELELALRQEIKDLQDHPVTEEELQQAKAQLLSAEVYGKDSVFQQAMILGMLDTIGLDWRISDTYAGQISAVTAAQLRSAALRYLTESGLTIATLRPVSGEGGGARSTSKHGQTTSSGHGRD